MRRQEGQAMLMVMVVMLILQLIAWAFLSRVNAEQRFAGGSARSLAALYLAEAGVQRALQVLEEGANGDSPLPHEEALGPGTFTIEALEQLPGGGLIGIVVRGEVAGAHRRLKVLTRVGPQALAYGLYGQGSVRFDGQARTYLLPFRAGGGGCRCTGDLAAGVEVRFDSPRAALNAFRGMRLLLRDGEIADHALLGPLETAGATDRVPGLVDVVLVGKARLVSGISHRPVGLEELRRQVAELGIRRLRARAALTAPSIDVNHYRALAEANTANASINSVAGEAAASQDLRTKAHSRYSVEEFEAILDYLQDTFRDRPRPSFQGTIFVEGDVFLEEGARLTIVDGALVAAGDIVVGEGARLEVRHGQAARALPGMIAWGMATIQIEEKAVAIVDGLVLTDGDVEVHGGVLDVIGAVAAKNFFTKDGTVVVRYDSGVLATMGLRRTGKGLAELVSWQELP